MDPIFFPNPEAFREWLATHHATETELQVGFYKKGTGKQTLTWQGAVDQAMCYGWIDGKMNSIDDDRYTHRFTPRKPTSTWSAVNIKRVGELTELGLMQPAGLAAFAARTEARSSIYAFEQPDTVDLEPKMTARFQANEAAWRYWLEQPFSYRKTAIWWVISAKRDETKQKRLMALINDSAEGRRLAQFSRPTPKTTATER